VREQREFCAAQARRAHARWARVHAEADEAPRVSRCVEIRVRDSHRPMTTISLRAEPTECGWGRFEASENGHVLARGRRLGRRQLAALIAAFLA